jgi:hypothetical protein
VNDVKATFMFKIYKLVEYYFQNDLKYCFLLSSYTQNYPHVLSNKAKIRDKKVIHLSTRSTTTIKINKSHYCYLLGVEKYGKKFPKHSFKDSIFMCCQYSFWMIKHLFSQTTYIAI